MENSNKRVPKVKYEETKVNYVLTSLFLLIGA